MYDLYEGDCLDLMENIPDGTVDLVLCDPPYGTTRNKWDSPIDLDKLWKLYGKVTHEHSVVVMFSQSPFDKVLACSNLKDYRYEWIWDKRLGTGFLNSKKMPLKVHETILVFYKKLPTYNPIFTVGKPYTKRNYGKSSCYGGYDISSIENDGTRYPTDILQFHRLSTTVHPSQKPVELMEYFIKTYTNEGDTVLDNCMGSGTTGVACVNTGRNFIGMEMDGKYFSIAKERIMQAEAERNGKLSNELFSD